VLLWRVTRAGQTIIIRLDGDLPLAFALPVGLAFANGFLLIGFRLSLAHFTPCCINGFVCICTLFRVARLFSGFWPPLVPLRILSLSLTHSLTHSFTLIPVV